MPRAGPRAPVALSPEIRRAQLILGLPKKPTTEQIKTAYHRKLLTVHPDINHDDPDATDKTREVVEAYEVLTRGLANVPAERQGPLQGIIEVDLLDLANSISATESRQGTPDLYAASYSGFVYSLKPNGRSQIVYDAHTAVRRLKQAGRYLYVVTYDSCDVLDHGTLVNRIQGDFGFDRTIFEPECIAILASKTLVRLYTPGGIPFGQIRFKENVADAFMHLGKLRVVTGKKSYWFAVNPPADLRGLPLEQLYLPT